MDTITIIKLFSEETLANNYAKENCGKIEISYDYDELTCSIIKVFIVKIKY